MTNDKTKNDAILIQVPDITLKSSLGEALAFVIGLGVTALGISATGYGVFLSFYPPTRELMLPVCKQVNSLCKETDNSHNSLSSLSSPKDKNSLSNAAQAWPDKLHSLKGIDYNILKDLLVAGRWQEADQETTKIMLVLLQKPSLEMVSGKDLATLPSEDLVTINNLWTRYSRGQFGLSVQAQIWYELGGREKPSQEIVNSFIRRVQWTSTIPTTQASVFNLNAPKGHLPSSFSIFLNLSAQGQVDKLSGYYLNSGAGFCHGLFLNAGVWNWFVWQGVQVAYLVPECSLN